MSIMHRFIPYPMIIPDESLPWISSTVLKAIRKRKSLYRLYRCTGSMLDLAKYKQKRNTVVALLWSRKEEYFKNLNPSNVKEFWKSIKKLNSKNSTTIPTLNNEGLLVNTSQGKAELLNEYFFGCFNCRCPPLRATHCPTYHLSNTELQEFPQEFLCTADTVADMLIGLDSTKSTGVDNTRIVPIPKTGSPGAFASGY